MRRGRDLQKLLRLYSNSLQPSNAISTARPLMTAAGLRDIQTWDKCLYSTTSLKATLNPNATAKLPLLINKTQKRTMFIQTQPTPNPSSLMFVPGKPVLDSGGSHNFSNAREAMSSPLAKRLFGCDGVTAVFFGSDFVTVTKSEEYAWAVLKPDVFAAITEFYAANEPLFYDSHDPTAAEHLIQEDDDEVVAMIKELLETRIRPAVMEDGGDIVFKEWDPDSGVVMLKMMGACSGCPSSSITLKSGIENMLMHYVPEVKGVIEAPADEYEEEGQKAFNKLEQHLSN